MVIIIITMVMVNSFTILHYGCDQIQIGFFLSIFKKKFFLNFTTGKDPKMLVRCHLLNH